MWFRAAHLKTAQLSTAVVEAFVPIETPSHCQCINNAMVHARSAQRLFLVVRK
jgi:hypothetical protein